MRTALSKSDNTAAAFCMMNYVGVDRAAAFLLELGVSEEHISRTPFGVTLGSSGITPVELTVAYGVLGNGGVYQEPISVLGISDANGDVVWDGHQHQERRRVFSDSTAWMIVDMLKTAVSSGTGTSARIKGQTVGGKTGTNSDQKGVFFAGMTGYYSSALWIGHDNYKALSSKSTGSGAAAPLWQAYMSRLHQGLDNRDILEGSASNYGLIRVETCGVSGQLATDACRRDVNGYGVTTDYWPQESAPTVSCQMHYSLDVCDQTGMLATAYCPSHSSKGVVILPIGHPLYEFTNSAYASVLSDYLGEYAALRLTADGNTNAQLLQSRACAVHQAGTVTYEQNIVENQLLPDAQRLLAQAQNQLNNTPEDQPGYAALSSAISNLSAVMYSNPSSAALASAMAALTQAMANAQGSW